MLTKLKIATAALLALAVLSSGASLAEERDKKKTEDKPREKPAERAQEKAPDLFGRVAEVSKDGKTVTVESPPKERGGEPVKTEVTIGEKTGVLYFDIGRDGAKPKVGYSVRVWLPEGGKGAAARISYSGGLGMRGTPADITARLMEVSKDGKTLKVQIASRNSDERKEVNVKIGDKTAVVFHNVGLGKAKFAGEMFVQVWLEEGSKENARAIDVMGSEWRDRRDGGNPGVFGKVVGIGKENKSITIEQQPKQRGEEPEKLEIKLSDKTSIAFRSVAKDGAKITKGFGAMVWLAEGSKDTADRVAFQGVVKEREERMNGPVSAVSKDGKTITLRQPPKERGEEPKEIEIKITDKTKVVFSGVGPGEAKPKDGYWAMVALKEGTKDTASVVVFHKPGAARGR